jgi:hypothetical protein
VSRYVTKNCAQCGVEMLRQHHAIYCLACARQRQHIRVAAPERACNQDRKRLKVDGVVCCVDCRQPVERTYRNGKLLAPSRRCWDCAALDLTARELVRNRAMRAVQKAIAKGLLARPTEFTCTDCARPATRYDHREYRKPLQVEPVCGSCNVMRGSAIDMDELIALAKREIIDGDAGPYLPTALRHKPLTSLSA